MLPHTEGRGQRGAMWRNLQIRTQQGETVQYTFQNSFTRFFVVVVVLIIFYCISFLYKSPFLLQKNVRNCLQECMYTSFCKAMNWVAKLHLFFPPSLSSEPLSKDLQRTNPL